MQVEIRWLWSSTRWQLFMVKTLLTALIWSTTWYESIELEAIICDQSTTDGSYVIHDMMRVEIRWLWSSTRWQLFMVKALLTALIWSTTWYESIELEAIICDQSTTDSSKMINNMMRVETLLESVLFSSGSLCRGHRRTDGILIVMFASLHETKQMIPEMTESLTNLMHLLKVHNINCLLWQVKMSISRMRDISWLLYM